MPSPPPLRAVLLEQLRATGLELRGAALIAAAIVGLITLVFALHSVSRGLEVHLYEWPTIFPGLLGSLLPVAVWARDDRFGPGFLWTLPVDRSRHAFIKVFAGWVWLMGGVALFALWLLGLTVASGGQFLPPDTLQLLTTPPPSAGPFDPTSLRPVSWAPGAQIWVVPFTAATAGYLLASALVLGTRYPRRWVIGTFLAYAFSSIASGVASAQLRLGWLADAPRRLLRLLIESRYGLDALLTARIDSLNSMVTLTNGEQAIVWRSVPDLSDWRTATLLWTGAGLLALGAAVSRHRERRRR